MRSAVLFTLPFALGACDQERPRELESQERPIGRFQATAASPSGVWVLDTAEGSISYCATDVRQGNSPDMKKVVIGCMPGGAAALPPSKR